MKLFQYDYYNDLYEISCDAKPKNIFLSNISVIYEIEAANYIIEIQLVIE
ncbi:unnamed protein product [Dracunculus medinensis]|uniref:Protein kinase domain-containing protein n=1 Tax=Dracunculus medinensis TaxID=318479 RepID=A0A0N4UMQ0_DRAME|nr:unnamed protein product [Dracunculus medinensis]